VHLRSQQECYGSRLACPLSEGEECGMIPHKNHRDGLWQRPSPPSEQSFIEFSPPHSFEAPKMAAILSVLTVASLFFTSCLCQVLSANATVCEPATITEYMVQDVYVSTYLGTATTLSIGSIRITATQVPAVLIGHVYLTETLIEVAVGCAILLMPLAGSRH
jgi:hypothetical protein